MKFLSALAMGALLVLAYAPAVAQDKKAEAKFDESKMVGKWSVVSAMRNGDDLEKKKRPIVTITKTTITIPAGEDKFVIDYKVDGKTDLATIDMEIKEGPVTGGKALGLITVSEKELKLCYAVVTEKGGKRPAKLESTKDNKAFYFVLKREK